MELVQADLADYDLGMGQWVAAQVKGLDCQTFLPRSINEGEALVEPAIPGARRQIIGQRSIAAADVEHIGTGGDPACDRLKTFKAVVTVGGGHRQVKESAALVKDGHLAAGAIFTLTYTIKDGSFGRLLSVKKE
jgi:hypothetical protein